MKSYRKEKLERNISAGLQLLLVALLLTLHVGLIVLLNFAMKENTGLIYLLLQLAGLGFALWIYNGYRPAAYKTVWILLVLSAPVVGLVLFSLWGDHGKGDRELKNLPPPAETQSSKAKSRQALDKLQQEHPRWSNVSSYLLGKGFPLYRNTRVEYFSVGERMLQDMLLEIEEAKRFILMEYFIMADGELMDRLLSRLYERAEHGVEVKIIYDDFGSMLKLSKETVEEMRSHGIQVSVFHPVLNYVNHLYLNYRDHRKICCIDGQIAYTGGVNLADEYANIIDRFGHWKDTGLRLDGAGAWGLTRQFIHMWEMLGGQMQEEHDYYRPLEGREQAGCCQPFTDGPLYRPDTPAEDVYLQLIGRAEHSLYITTPYLCPDEMLVKALCVAAAGGVDVRLMLPEKPDHYFTYVAGETYYGELMRHGVQIYTYTPGFLHAKSIVADREAAVVGTVNMDYRSFQLHYECGVFLCGSPAVEQLCSDLDEVLENSSRVTEESWAKRSRLRRFLGYCCKVFAPWM